ncbi:L-arabinose isomerase family protein [Rubrivirga sp.]|uniref:L-arabinose isomerase family protein n=1 Tax=Rubrivirga sp. TaxID=1885344 RepID=UPI003B516DD3
MPSATRNLPARVGLFGVGLDTYWAQFDGLRDRLEGYQAQIADRLAGEVVDGGLVDSVEAAREAAERFRHGDVDVVFLYVSTYALSSTVLPVVQRVGVPVVVLNLQPTAAIDYGWFNGLKDRHAMTGEWLANCQACAVPEIASVLMRAGVGFHQVTGTLDDDVAWAEIDAWTDAARAARVLRESRLGLLGHYYNGMLDLYTDPTLQSVAFGSEVVHLEMDALQALRESVTDGEVDAMLDEIDEAFDVSPECARDELRRAARTAVALDRLADAERLGALAYYYEGVPGGTYEDLIGSVIVGTSLLTARGVPVAGEYDVKNAQAMKVMDALGAGGSFTEFYGMDFDDDVVLMGHDGPGHIRIAEGKPRLKPLAVYHGKPSHGLSVEMSVAHGPATALAVVQTGAGRLKLLVAEGEAVPGPILEIGNTNSRYRFPLGVRAFMDRWCAEGPHHHCAIGVGHQGSRIEKLGALLGLEVVQIC